MRLDASQFAGDGAQGFAARRELDAMSFSTLACQASSL